jgi:phosphoglycolate phosphatase
MKKFWFFDLDGTLADTDRDIRESWKAAMKDLNLFCENFDEKFVAGPPIDEMLRRLFPAEYTDELAIKMRERFAYHYDSDGFPNTFEYPGIIDEIKALKKDGATLAIVTNKRYAGATAMAKHFSWDEIFDDIFAGDMFSGKKMRKTELLAYVIEKLGAEKSDCVLVGDTSNDFEAATSNGVFSVGVEWGYGTSDELSMADITIKSASKLRVAVP